MRFSGPYLVAIFGIISTVEFFRDKYVEAIYYLLFAVTIMVADIWMDTRISESKGRHK